MRVRDTTAETAPTLATTKVLFNFFTHFAGVPSDMHECVRHTVAIANDQAGTLQLVWSQDGVGSPTTWKVVQQVAVAIPAAPLTMNGPYDFAVDGLRYYGVLWINGGVTQTTWLIDQEITERQRGAQT